MGRYTVTVIGPKNGFGQLDGPYTPVDGFALQGIAPARGESLQCVDSPFYDVHPGQVHYFSAFAPNGNVIVICGSQSNNPLSNSATDCQVLAFDPNTLRWQTIQIPTVATATGRLDGQWSVVGSNGITGGMDCADVGVYIDPNDPQPNGYNQAMLVMTFGTYSGWDLHNGEYPIFALIEPYSSPNTSDPVNGRIRTWRVDRKTTAKDLLNSSPSKAAGIYETKAGTNGNYTDAKAPGEFSQFPQSRAVVFGHYFPWNGGTSGAFSVVDPTNGTLHATYKMPNCTGPGIPGYNGGPYLWCAPREIECDPSSSINDERFTVIYDTYPYAGIGVPGAPISPSSPSAPHLLQEFSYNASTGTITPISGFVNVRQDDTPPTPNDPNHLGPGGPSELGTMRFDSAGNLFVTTNTIFSLQPNNPMAVFKKVSGERTYVSQVPASSGWETRYNVIKAVPDFYVPAVGRNSPVAYSHDLDSSRRNVMAVGLNGILTVVNWDSGFPVGSNVLPTNVQCNQATQPSTMPFTAGFGTATLSWFQFNSKWGLKMVSTVANSCNAITPRYGGFTVGRQYRARCDFAAAIGSTPKKCDIKVNCWDSGGNFIGAVQQVATVSVVNTATVNSGGSNPTALMQTVETNFDVLDGTSTVSFELFLSTTAAGQTHYAQNFTVQQLPFKRTAVIDMGITKLRNTATAYPGATLDQNAHPIQIRKSCFDQANNKLYTTAGFLGQQILGPVSAPPSTPRQIAQYLVCTDIGNIGAAAPGDQKVQSHIFYSANMDTSYHANSYPFSLPAGGASPMCGFVVNIPVATYPFSWGYQGWYPYGGGILGAPAAVSTGEGQEHVFVIGTDRRLYYRYQHGATTDGWASPGGTCVTDPVAVVEPVPVLGGTGYNIHVFVVGADNQVWQITRGPLGNWGAWTPRGGYIAPQFQGAFKAMAAACLGTGKIDVYVAAGNSQIWRLSLRNGAWVWTNTGIWSDGYINAWGEQGSNGGRVWMTIRQTNGTTGLVVLPDGGPAGAIYGNVGGGTSGRSAIVGLHAPTDALGVKLSLDILTVGLGSPPVLWRNHYQSYNPGGYGYTNVNTWTGYQALPALSGGVNPGVGAAVGFHDNRNPNGVPYLTWDAFVCNSNGSGAYGLAYVGS